jgi:hypothetical protein
MQRLIGQRSHGSLGSFENQDPAVVLAQVVSDVLPSHDLYPADLAQQPMRRR